MRPIDETSIVVQKRQYPHVDAVPEFNTQQSLRLLWDRIFALQEQLTAAQATITDLVAGHNTTEADLVVAQRAANHALALTQTPPVPAAGGGGGGGGGDTGLPGGGDGGDGQEGCNAGLPNGHDSGGLLNAVRAGQIVCGTGNEWAALRNPTPTVDERLANAAELLERIIWHLRLAGFSAGRQRNPSGLLSRDKIAVVCDEILRAYDIFIAFDDNTRQMQVAMGEIGSPNLVDDAGTPD